MKVLIIEDDFISRKYMYDLLSYSGYDCYTAQNAADGLDVYTKVKPSAVVCNLIMHGISGLEFLRLIKQKYPEANVILTTSQSSEKLVIQALKLGAKGYVKKPIQDTEILPILEKIEKNKIEKTSSVNDYGCVTNGNITLKFNTEYGAPSLIVDRLMREVNNIFDDDDQNDIAIGLSELVTNAIEHGNLNISYEEKQEVTLTDKLDELYFKRLSDSKLASRKVTINYEFSPKSCSWIISDEGNGFDWTAVPDPTLEENIIKLSGRGIYITKRFFDSLEYLGKGNVVKVVKNRKKN